MSEIRDTEYAEALSRRRSEATTELRARAVSYLADRDVLKIETTRGSKIEIPRALVIALQNVSPDELAAQGMARRISDRARVTRHSDQRGWPLTALLPALLQEAVLETLFARRGGQATSEAKRWSAQDNGKKSGRPRKRVA